MNQPRKSTLGEKFAWDAGGQGGQWPDWVDNPDKPNPTGRTAFFMWPHWKASGDVLPSGLIGPVQLFKSPIP